MENYPEVFKEMMIVWIAIGVPGSLYFWLSKNAKLKRQLWFCYILLVAVLFCYYGVRLGFPLKIFVPMTFAITLGNLFFIKFCDQCGKFYQCMNPFADKGTCIKCADIKE